MCIYVLCIVYFNKGKLKIGYVKIVMVLIVSNEPLGLIENFGMLHESRNTHFHWFVEDTNNTFCVDIYQINHTEESS